MASESFCKHFKVRETNKLSKSQTEAPAGGLKQNTQSVDLRCFISRPCALHVVNKHVSCLIKRKKKVNSERPRPHVSETKALEFFLSLEAPHVKIKLCFSSSKCDGEIFQSLAPKPPHIIPPVTVRKLLDWPSPPARGTQRS